MNTYITLRACQTSEIQPLPQVANKEIHTHTIQKRKDIYLTRTVCWSCMGMEKITQWLLSEFSRCPILQVQLLSSECLQEARKVNAAMSREEMLRKLAAEEKARNLHAMREIEEAKRLLSSEACGRQIAELNALRESVEKQDVLAAVLHSNRRYRRYTPEDIEAAISESNVIGEGGYGKVYKCTLHHTPVAVKILRPDATEKKDEFLKEVIVSMCLSLSVNNCSASVFLQHYLSV